MIPSFARRWADPAVRRENERLRFEVRLLEDRSRQALRAALRHGAEATRLGGELIETRAELFEAQRLLAAPKEKT